MGDRARARDRAALPVRAVLASSGSQPGGRRHRAQRVRRRDAASPARGELVERGRRTSTHRHAARCSRPTRDRYRTPTVRSRSRCSRSAPDALEVVLEDRGSRRRPTRLRESDNYETIGQFYDAIEHGLRDLSARLGEANVFCGDPAAAGVRRASPATRAASP